MLSFLTLAALMHLHMAGEAPATEMRFILLAPAASRSELEKHTEQAFAYTQTHFALYRLQEGRNVHVICLTEPDNFNVLRSRRSMKATSGTYRIVAVPNLDTCKATQLHEEMLNSFVLSLTEGDIVEVSCREAGTFEPTCHSAPIPTYERH